MSRLAPLLLTALVLTACADPQAVLQATSEPAAVAAEPPADAFSPLASLSPAVVVTGDTLTEITIAAAAEPLGSGTYFRIERWDGERWVLQHYVWHGEVQPADLDGFNDDGYGIEPGEALVERLPLDDLDEGVHRVGLAMWQGDYQDGNRVDVYARLDVRSPADVEAPAASPLDGSQWHSLVVEGLDLPADTHIRLTFDHGMVSASVGCNSVGGPYELIDGQLVADELESTAMDCPQPESSWDDWVTVLLLGTPTVELDERLTLTAGGDRVIFERYVEPTPTPTDPDSPLSTWVPPADYRYTISGSCGPDARFLGEREVTVRDGVPSDEAAFLPTLLADAEEIRAGGADTVRVEHDPDGGHPTAIFWDVDSASSTDSEVCYGVTGFQDLGVPSSARPTDTTEVPPPGATPAAIRQAELVDPSTLQLGIGSCNADLFTTVTETDTTVEVTVHKVNDTPDDCGDGVTIELNRPLGDRDLIDTSTGGMVRVEGLPDE